MDALPGLVEFVAVVDTGGFSRAAERLDVSNSYVSSQVRRLEERIGVRLLNRTTRRIGLTSAGEALYGRGAEILRELREVEFEFRERQVEPTGKLTVSLPPLIGERFLAPLMAKFLQRFARVSLDLSITTRLVDLISEGFDVAIRLGTDPPPGLIARALAQTRFRIFAAPRYIERHGAPRTPAAIASHACMVFGYPGSAEIIQWTLAGADGRPFAVPVQYRWRSDNPGAVIEGAVAGAGMAYMPEFYVTEERRAGKLVPVMQEWTNHRTTLWLIYPHRRQLPRATRQFIDYLLESFAPGAPWDEELERPRAGDGPGEPRVVVS